MNETRRARIFVISTSAFRLQISQCRCARRHRQQAQSERSLEQFRQSLLRLARHVAVNRLAREIPQDRHELAATKLPATQIFIDSPASHVLRIILLKLADESRWILRRGR